MIIRTERLLLVPLGPEYLISAHKYSSDIENTKYMMFLPNTDISETESFLHRVQEEWQKPSPDRKGALKH